MTKIIAAAVVWGDKIYSIPAPARHHTILHRMDALIPGLPDGFGWEQGFITDKGEYVGRQEAWWLAAAAGQIPQLTPARPRDLFSEDIW